MASWIVHLRIADELLNNIPNLFDTEFVVGNMAPDSGVPNEDWSIFTPSTQVSHFKSELDGLKNIDLKEYVDKFFNSEQRSIYTNKEKSFYLGYLTHLLTDIMWVEEVVKPSKEKFKDLYNKDKLEWIGTVKEDWYDLDFLYLNRNPNFKAFSIYKDAVGFRNSYLDFFSEDAFDNRREYIVGFYSEERDNLERCYTYLKEEEMNSFVEKSAYKISEILKEDYL